MGGSRADPLTDWHFQTLHSPLRPAIHPHHFTTHPGCRSNQCKTSLPSIQFVGITAIYIKEGGVGTRSQSPTRPVELITRFLHRFPVHVRNTALPFLTVSLIIFIADVPVNRIREVARLQKIFHFTLANRRRHREELTDHRWQRTPTPPTPVLLHKLKNTQLFTGPPPKATCRSQLPPTASIPDHCPGKSRKLDSQATGDGHRYTSPGTCLSARLNRPATKPRTSKPTSRSPGLQEAAALRFDDLLRTKTTPEQTKHTEPSLRQVFL